MKPGRVEHIIYNRFKWAPNYFIFPVTIQKHQFSKPFPESFAPQHQDWISSLLFFLYQSLSILHQYIFHDEWNPVLTISLPSDSPSDDHYILTFDLGLSVSLYLCHPPATVPLHSVGDHFRRLGWYPVSLAGCLLSLDMDLLCVFDHCKYILSHRCHPPKGIRFQCKLSTIIHPVTQLHNHAFNHVPIILFAIIACCTCILQVSPAINPTWCTFHSPFFK